MIVLFFLIILLIILIVLICWSTIEKFGNVLIKKNWLKDYVDAVYVIYVPERETYIKEFMKKINCDALFVSAIEKNTINKSLLKKQKLLSTNHELNNAEIGCAMSHLSILQHFKNNKSLSKILILEDDVILQYNAKKTNKILQNTKTYMNDCDILKLGQAYADCQNHKVITNGLFQSVWSVCAHANIYNKKAASSIIAAAYPLWEPIDIIIARLAEKGTLVVYEYIPSLIVQNREKFRSLISFKREYGSETFLPACEHDLNN